MTTLLRRNQLNLAVYSDKKLRVIVLTEKAVGLEVCSHSATRNRVTGQHQKGKRASSIAPVDLISTVARKCGLDHNTSPSQPNEQ